MISKQGLAAAIRNAVDGFDCSDSAQLGEAMDAVMQILPEPVADAETTDMFKWLNEASKHGHRNLCRIVGINSESDLSCWLLESRMQSIVDERDKVKYEYEGYMHRRRAFMEKHGLTNENSFSCITYMIQELEASQPATTGAIDSSKITNKLENNHETSQ